MKYIMPFFVVLLFFACADTSPDIVIKFDRNVDLGVGDSLYEVNKIGIGSVQKISAADSGGVVVRVDVENNFKSRLTRGKDFVYVNRGSSKRIEMVTTAPDHELLPNGAQVDGYSGYAEYHFRNRTDKMAKLVEDFTTQGMSLLSKMDKKLSGADSLKLKLTELKQRAAEYTGPEEREEIRIKMEKLSKELHDAFESVRDDDWEDSTIDEMNKAMNDLDKLWKKGSDNLEEVKDKAAEVVEKVKKEVDSMRD